MEKANIYQRINAVRKEIGYVQKDKEVGFGKSSYRAVTHDAVTGMVRASLIKHGIVIVPSVVSATFHPAEMVTSLNDNGQAVTTSAKQRLYEATFQIDFVNIDDPTERISTQQIAHALDNGDKSPGKAMSYATKYAMLKLFNIETGEDEESRHQQDDYDFADALNRAEKSESADMAREIIKEAKQRAVATKDGAAIKAIDAVSNKLKEKFGARKPTANDMAAQA